MAEPRRRAFDALQAAYAGAQSEDWDSEGSAPVEPSTFMHAYNFLAALPTHTPAPDVAIDPDGEISFEWDGGSRKVFSVSVGSDGTLTFAGLFGHSRVHGLDHFVDSVPTTVSAGIERAATGPVA